MKAAWMETLAMSGKGGAVLDCTNQYTDQTLFECLFVGQEMQMISQSLRSLRESREESASMRARHVAAEQRMPFKTQRENCVTPARIGKHPFLRGLKHNQLVLLADCAMITYFGFGETIFREGEKDDYFLLIEKGKVVLNSGKGVDERVLIETIGAGDFLGWSWMMPPNAWHFTARAVGPTRAIYFMGPILRDYCERHHSLGFELHKRMGNVMTERLQTARRKILAIRKSGSRR